MGVAELFGGGGVAPAKGGQPKVMVASPCYGGLLHMSVHTWVLAQASGGLVLTHVCLGHESLITRARNKLLAMFLANPGFTHLLWLDADVELSTDALPRLLATQKDVVGVPVALRGLRDGAPVLNCGKVLSQDNVIAKVEWVGTAALLMSRRAAEAVVSDAAYYADDGAYTHGDTQPLRIWDVFGVGIHDGHYYSEDQTLCESLKKHGFGLYVVPAIRSLHHGGGDWPSWREEAMQK